MHVRCMQMAASGSLRKYTKLFVYNLRWTTSADCLRAYFSKFGRVKFARVVFDTETGWSKNYAFVGMDGEESAKSILNHKPHMISEYHQMQVRIAPKDNPSKQDQSKKQTETLQ